LPPLGLAPRKERPSVPPNRENLQENVLEISALGPHHGKKWEILEKGEDLR
jgi:hypothetical protein